jgi:hypothetical protein
MKDAKSCAYVYSLQNENIDPHGRLCKRASVKATV